MSIQITPGFNNDLVDVTKYECKLYVDDVVKQTIYVDADKYRNVIGTFDLSSWATEADDGKLLTIVVTPQAQYIDGTGATQDSATGYSSETSEQYVNPGTPVGGFNVAGGLVDLSANGESVNLSVDFLWGDDDERPNVNQSDIKFLLFAEDVSGNVQNLGMAEKLLLKADGTTPVDAAAGALTTSILNYGSFDSVYGIGYDQLDEGVVSGLNVVLKSAGSGSEEDILVKLFGDLQLFSSTKFYLVAAQPLKTGYGYKYNDGTLNAHTDDNVYGFHGKDVLLSAPVSVTLNSISSAPTLEKINGIVVSDEAAWATATSYTLTGYAAQHVKEASMVVQYLTKEDNTHYKTHSLISKITWLQDETDASKWTFSFGIDLTGSDEELHVITLGSKNGGFVMVRNSDHISA